MIPNTSRDRYMDYQRIAPSNYRAKILFFDQYRGDLEYLDPEDKLEIYLDFVSALFEVGNYYRYLHYVNGLIEQVIADNIYYFREEKIFESLLFRKAASLYNIHKYPESISILKSLLKIDPKYPAATPLLVLSLRQIERPWYEWSKAIAIVLLFSAISIWIAEFLVISSFYEHHLATVHGWRISFLSIGVSLLVLREVYLFFVISREMR